jgi:hypothetical protein
VGKTILIAASLSFLAAVLMAHAGTPTAVPVIAPMQAHAATP